MAFGHARIVTGAELRKLRARAGLSQAALATRADVDRRTIMRWENGQAPLPKLAALGLKALLRGRRTAARPGEGVTSSLRAEGPAG
jgi:transcriptional regulator with XRE-family HTH domain